MDAQTSVVSDINNLIEIYGMFDSEILQGLPLFSKAAKIGKVGLSCLSLLSYNFCCTTCWPSIFEQEHQQKQNPYCSVYLIIVYYKS